MPSATISKKSSASAPGLAPTARAAATSWFSSRPAAQVTDPAEQPLELGRGVRRPIGDHDLAVTEREAGGRRVLRGTVRRHAVRQLGCQRLVDGAADLLHLVGRERLVGGPARALLPGG